MKREWLSLKKDEQKLRKAQEVKLKASSGWLRGQVESSSGWLRGQVESEQWMVERRKQLTASNAGSIAKMRKTTKRSNQVKGLLYSHFRGNVATLYGITTEENLDKLI